MPQPRIVSIDAERRAIAIGWTIFIIPEMRAGRFLAMLGFIDVTYGEYGYVQSLSRHRLYFAIFSVFWTHHAYLLL